MMVAWDTTRNRRAGEKALSAAFEQGLHAGRAGRRGRSRVWSSRGGVIALGGSALRTAVVLAPDSPTAARVLAQLG
jgi:hypothetical protein